MNPASEPYGPKNLLPTVLHTLFDANQLRASPDLLPPGPSSRAGRLKRCFDGAVDAEAKVQTILGEAEPSKIYAEAYGGTPERESFNEFMKLLESYDKTLDEKTTGLLSTKSELFRLFNGMDSE